MEDQTQQGSLESVERALTVSSAGVLRKSALYILLVATIAPFVVAILMRLVD